MSDQQKAVLLNRLRAVPDLGQVNNADNRSGMLTAGGAILIKVFETGAFDTPKNVPLAAVLDGVISRRNDRHKKLATETEVFFECVRHFDHDLYDHLDYEGIKRACTFLADKIKDAIVSGTKQPPAVDAEQGQPEAESTTPEAKQPPADDNDKQGVSPLEGATAANGGGNGNTTPPGGAKLKIVAALTKHHEYATDSCLNTDPIGVNALARKAEVSPGSVTNFFNKNFGGHGNYKAVCRTPATLVNYIKALDAGFCPWATFAKPTGESSRDDE